MLHVRCVSCGVDGVLLADESRDVPRCLQCGRPFQVASPQQGHARRTERPTEAVIMTWLYQVSAPPPQATVCDFACRYCGYIGAPPRKNRLGVAACPACGEFVRPRRKYGRSKTVCPDCCLIFELSSRDRGRTILCPGCNCFLGCLLPIERERNKPFWSLR